MSTPALTGTRRNLSRGALRACVTLTRETLWAAGLVALLVLLTSLLAGWGLDPEAGRIPFGRRLLGFASTIHVDRYGAPLWPQFVAVCGQTAPLLLMSALYLLTLSLTAGVALVIWPRLQPLRWLILALSAVPSFAWPLVVFLIWPERPFSALQNVSPLGWPALCLAVGDLNWITGATFVAEAVKRDIASPHWRLASLLRIPPAVTFAPRLLTSSLALLASRWPHLLGGTVAVEVLFRIRGIGLWTWNAFSESPPDPKVLLWVGMLGIVLSRVFRLALLLAESLFPETRGGTSGRAELPAAESADDLPETADAGRQSAAQYRLVREPEPPAAAIRHAPPGFFESLRSRWSYYFLVAPENRLKAFCALAFVALWCGLGLLVAVTATNLPAGQARPFQPPVWSDPFGTDGVGDHVVLLLWKGWWQQLPAWALCVAILWCAVPLTLADFVRSWSVSPLVRGVLAAISFLTQCLGALVDATPKLIWLLACFTVFTHEHAPLKMAAAMGLLFVPQLHAALRDESRTVGSTKFLEIKKMARVSWWRVLWDNVCMAHVLPVVCIQTALILGNVVLTEAWLGYLGIRNRDQIFTWGAVLGTGIDEFVSMRRGTGGGQEFNDAGMYGPFLCLWLTICVLTIAGHTFKVLTGSYVWRLR